MGSDRGMATVGIVGGGVAGVTTALVLAEIGFDVKLFEQRGSLVTGPPFCHLHAGGNLYREISDDQCVTLLRQSVEFARLYPFAIDRRPTLIAIPTEDDGSFEALLPRLRLLREEYRKLTEKDASNSVLGDPNDYFTLFTKEQIEEAASIKSSKPPSTPKEWVAPAARSLDLSRLKSPLILVQEFGVNLFRLSAGAFMALSALENVETLLKSSVTGVEPTEKGYLVSCSTDGKKREYEVDFLVNAAGFQTGVIDDMLGVKALRMVEFKAAYTSFWEKREEYWPEVIFHGKRGTPRGMAQFTPYAGGYVQLHGMTKDITLFEHGLVCSGEESSMPKLPKNLQVLIDEGWPKELAESRTKRAIEFAARFIPGFKEAKTGGPPLFGAQQIPGDDPELRVAEVSFARPRYARCEIVKVSSVTDMVEAIVEELAKEGLCKSDEVPESIFALKGLDEQLLESEAVNLAKKRGYPAKMGELLCKNSS